MGSLKVAGWKAVALAVAIALFGPVVAGPVGFVVCFLVLWAGMGGLSDFARGCSEIRYQRRRG